MATYESFKVPVYPHVLETVEEEMERNRLLLWRIGERSSNLAQTMDDGKPENDPELLKEAVEFLHEVKLTLGMMTDLMENQEDWLRGVRRGAVKEVTGDEFHGETAGGRQRQGKL